MLEPKTMLEGDLLEQIKNQYNDLYLEIIHHKADGVASLLEENTPLANNFHENTLHDPNQFIELYTTILNPTNLNLKRPVIIINKSFLQNDSLLEFLVLLCNRQDISIKIVVVGDSDLDINDAQKAIIQNATKCRVIFKTSIR